jgi:hypothetical protein
MNADKFPHPDQKVLRELHRRSRRSFVAAGATALGTWGILRWSDRRPDGIGQTETLQQRVLRNVLDWNAAASRALLGERALAPTYPAAKASRDVRINGPIGIDTGLKLDAWRLQVVGLANPKAYPEFVTDVDTFVYQSATDDSNASAFVTDTDTKEANGAKTANPGGSKDAVRATADSSDPSLAATPGLLLTMDHIRKLPHVEMVTQLKCIEGWSQIVHWGGARFADFIDAYKPATTGSGRPLRFISLETPSGEYYVGLDLLSALHPQTLLCYEMNGLPLTREHGAPLRLVTSLKYGIKQLKQIGKITFTDQRPKDYWAEQGYDWYAGL